MNAIKEFAAFEGKPYAATTRRVYVSAAKKALKFIGKTPCDCGSYEELLGMLREKIAKGELPRALRLSPFLAFLDSKVPKAAVELPDLEPVRVRVVTRIEAETKAARKVSHLIRRDLAMVACMCIAPERGSPQRWPKSVLEATRQKGGAFNVRLWDKEVEAPGLALALLYWQTWRERLDRPEQSRIHRKAWAYSDLLFPNSKGEALKRQVVHDALSRLSIRFEGRLRLTPQLIRQAFLQLKA